MSRHVFGQTPTDWTFTVGDGATAVLAGGVEITFWDNPTSGTQYTDLLDVTGTAVTSVTSADGTGNLPIGSIPRFSGPDGVTSMWADAGGGYRAQVTALDIGADVADLQAATAAHAAARNPHMTRLQDLGDVYDPNIDAYIAAVPFTAAHRGSGGEFPEHTVVAYESALAAMASAGKIPAIEVSVRRTADDVLVCMHDPDLDRTTDHTGPIADWTLAALQQTVSVTSQGLLGAGWSNQPIPTLDDVMKALYGRCIIFLEAKSNDAIVPLQDYLLDKYPGCQRSVIWKGYYQSSSFEWAQTNDFFVWGYIDPTTTSGSMDTYDSKIDMWGVPVESTDSQISMVVARGKPVMVWEVHRYADVERLTALDVDGFMQAQWLYLNNDPAFKGDLFASRISQPGTLGISKYDPAYALTYDGSGGAQVPKVPNDAVLMGGHRVADANSHTIGFSMKWDTVPASTLHSDVAFCRSVDDPYQFANALTAYGDYASPGGYHAIIRGNGDLQLYRHDKGNTSGTKLAEVLVGAQPSGAAPVNGGWMDFVIEVTPTDITLRRTDLATDVVVTVANTAYRGRYWHLSNGSVSSTANKPTFKAITVDA